MAGTAVRSDPKPARRIVDPTAMPADGWPFVTNRCPVCYDSPPFHSWDRVHVVGKGSGGDDLPENLVWLCSLCHDALHRRARSAHGKPYGLIAERFVRYVRSVTEVYEYVEHVRYQGWLENYYTGEDRLP